MVKTLLIHINSIFSRDSIPFFTWKLRHIPRCPVLPGPAVLRGHRAARPDSAERGGPGDGQLLGAARGRSGWDASVVFTVANGIQWP